MLPMLVSNLWAQAVLLPQALQVAETTYALYTQLMTLLGVFLIPTTGDCMLDAQQSSK
jgi:hypothetical protein